MLIARLEIIAISFTTKSSGGAENIAGMEQQPSPVFTIQSLVAVSYTRTAKILLFFTVMCYICIELYHSKILRHFTV